MSVSREHGCVVFLPFCAIKLFPRAGKPTMTTHIRVSSACTPAPLVFLLGLTKSPVGTLRICGAKKPLASASVMLGAVKSPAPCIVQNPKFGCCAMHAQEPRKLIWHNPSRRTPEVQQRLCGF
jgi:hypothetical protein